MPIMIQRLVPQLQTVPKTGEVPQTQLIDRFVPPAISQVTKHVEIPLIKYIIKVIAVPIVIQRQVPQFPTVAKAVEAPKMQFIGNFVDVPVLMQRQVPQFQTLLITGKVPQVSVCTYRSLMCRCFMSRSRSALWSVCHEQSLTCQFLKKSTRASSRGVEIPPPVAMQRQVPQLQTVAKTGVFPSINQVTNKMVPRIRTSWKTCGGACVHADAPFVSTPVPQILEEPIDPQFQVENAEEAQLFPHERISELTIEVDDVHLASATVAGKRKKKKTEEGRRRRSHRGVP